MHKKIYCVHQANTFTHDRCTFSDKIFCFKLCTMQSTNFSKDIYWCIAAMYSLKIAGRIQIKYVDSKLICNYSKKVCRDSKKCIVVQIKYTTWKMYTISEQVDWFNAVTKYSFIHKNSIVIPYKFNNYY